MAEFRVEGDTQVLAKLTEFIMNIACPILEIEKDALYAALCSSKSQEN